MLNGCRNVGFCQFTTRLRYPHGVSGLAGLRYFDSGRMFIRCQWFIPRRFDTEVSLRTAVRGFMVLCRRIPLGVLGQITYSLVGL